MKYSAPFLVACLAFALTACTKVDDGGPAGTGGAKGSGGATGTGGAPSGTGGSAPTATGGSQASGGSTAGMGGSATGGSTGSGGSVSGTGGSGSGGSAGGDAGAEAGNPVIWKNCFEPVFSSILPAEFCPIYEKVCGFGAGRYASLGDCMTKFKGGSNDTDACRSGRLCRASKNYYDAAKKAMVEADCMTAASGAPCR